MNNSKTVVVTGPLAACVGEVDGQLAALGYAQSTRQAVQAVAAARAHATLRCTQSSQDRATRSSVVKGHLNLPVGGHRRWLWHKLRDAGVSRVADEIGAIGAIMIGI